VEHYALTRDLQDDVNGKATNTFSASATSEIGGISALSLASRWRASEVEPIGSQRQRVKTSIVRKSWSTQRQLPTLSDKMRNCSVVYSKQLRLRLAIAHMICGKWISTSQRMANLYGTSLLEIEYQAVEVLTLWARTITVYTLRFT